MNINLSEDDVKLLIAALWNRVVFTDTQWRICLAEDKLKAAASLHRERCVSETLILHLKRSLP